MGVMSKRFLRIFNPAATMRVLVIACLMGFIAGAVVGAVHAHNTTVAMKSSGLPEYNGGVIVTIDIPKNMKIITVKSINNGEDGILAASQGAPVIKMSWNNFWNSVETGKIYYDKEDRTLFYVDSGTIFETSVDEEIYSIEDKYGFTVIPSKVTVEEGTITAYIEYPGMLGMVIVTGIAVGLFFGGAVGLFTIVVGAILDKMGIDTESL